MSYDAEMIAHAAARGRVLVVPPNPLAATEGQLIAWRPSQTGRARSYTARVLHDNGRPRTYPLNHYTIEAIK